MVYTVYATYIYIYIVYRPLPPCGVEVVVCGGVYSVYSAIKGAYYVYCVYGVYCICNVCCI